MCAVGEDVPRDEAATSEVAEDTEAESTDTDVEEETYLVKGVRGAEQNTKCAMWPCKGPTTSMGMIGDEDQRMTVTDQGSGRGKTSAANSMRCDIWQAVGTRIRSKAAHVK